MTRLLSYIEEKRLFDPNNNVMIICSQLLDNALNVHSFHIDQMYLYVLPHIVKISTHLNYICMPLMINYHQPENLKFNGPLSTKFILQPKCIEILRAFLPRNYETSFTYDNIVLFFRNYIMRDKQSLVDIRNKFVIFIKNHPLQILFKAEAIHRKQFEQFIFKQIVFSKLSDLCAFKVAKMVSKENIPKLDIPTNLKISLHSMNRISRGKNHIIS